MSAQPGAVHRVRTGLIASGVILAVGIGAARQQAVFKASVDHVTVDVIATDSHDQPVLDLKQDDFQITEADRPQKIADFEHVSIPAVHRSIDPVSAEAVPSDVAANRPPSADSRVWVIIIDDVHLLPQFITPVKKVLSEFLQSLPPRDEVAITFVGRSDLSQNFTTDLGRLLKAVDSVRAVFGFGTGADALAAPPSPRASGPVEQALQDARSAAFVLTNTASTLANSGHARRAIVYVSAQSVLDPAAPIVSFEFASANRYREYLEAAFTQARQADVPIYTIDPRGLVQPETATKGMCCTTAQQRAAVQHRIVVQQDYLASIATNTGGRFFINQSNLAGAVDEIVAENSSYYLLGYYPDPFARDGKFHDLKVTVTRPGVRVRARTGYTAPSASAGEATTKSALSAAVSTGYNLSGLSLRAYAAPVSPSAKGMNVVVTTDVTYPPATEAAGSQDTVHWEVVALDPDGKIRAGVENSAPITVTSVGSHFVVNEVLDLPSQPTTVRVAVSSTVLAKTGSVQLSLEVPNFLSGKLQVGTVVLGAVDAKGRGAPEPPSLKALLPFQPTTSRAFPATDTLQVYAPTAWASKDQAAHVSISVRRGSDVVIHRDADVQGAVIKDENRSGATQVDVPLTDLTPGSYTLVVEARLPGGQTASRAVPFDIK